MNEGQGGTRKKEGRGGMRDKEEGWKRRMREGRGGGRKDEEEGATRRVKKRNDYKGPKVGGAGREMEMPQKKSGDLRGSWKSLRGSGKGLGVS